MSTNSNNKIASFDFRISRNSLSSPEELRRTVALLKIGINLNPILKYPVSERKFENASAVFANIEHENNNGRFGELLKSSVEGLGYFVPDAAELVSFIYYNAPGYSDHFPENIICGVRKDKSDEREIILVLSREGLGSTANLTLREISVREISKEFEILIVREQKGDD
jgi:hypothetical protein